MARPATPLLTRFWNHIDISESGCWMWTGAAERNGGYAVFDRTAAHRRSYEIHRGVIPPLFDVHHLCNERRCVNPEHLEAIDRLSHVLKTPGTWGERSARMSGGGPTKYAHRRRLFWRNAPEPTPPEQRFWNHVEFETNTGCWLWSGGKNGKPGYGLIGLGPRQGLVLAHRLSYQMHKGPIPSGKHIDHLCRVRSCVNPDHLEAVTHGENLRRSPITFAGKNAAKTHCPRGHEYALKNTYSRAANSRSCRRCHADRESIRRLEATSGNRIIKIRMEQTHCKRGHEFTQENTYIAPHGGRLCRACGAAAARQRRIDTKLRSEIA